MVAVVTNVKGFDTLVGLLPAFAFHAFASVAGLQLLRAASKRNAAAAMPEPAPAAE